MYTPHAVIRAYMGRLIRSSTGPTLGHVVDVLADARSRSPHWLVIRLRGPLGGHRALPLALSLQGADGLLAPVSRRTLQNSPRIRVGASLTARQELDVQTYWMTH